MLAEVVSVEDHGVGGVVGQGFDRLDAVARLPDGVAVGLQRQSDERPDIGVIVDNENFGHVAVIGAAGLGIEEGLC